MDYSLTIPMGLLVTADDEQLSTIMPELRKTWQSAQMFRTATEMQVAVLDDIRHPTPDAKYWQAVREQNVQFSELMNLTFEWRKNVVEIKRIQRELVLTEDELDREWLEIELERLQWLATQMNRVAHHRVREIMEWSSIKSKLVPLLEFGTDDVNAHQLQAMRVRFDVESNLITDKTPVADMRNILGLAITAKRVAEQRGGGHNGGNLVSRW